MVNISDIVKPKSLEDRLTAQLLLTLEQCPPEIFLKPFLERIGIEEETEDISFGLQVKEISSIPDAKIEGSSFLVYIESKLGDNLDPIQILNHFKAGQGKKPKFCVLCITGGFDEPEGRKEALMRLEKSGLRPDIRWTSWRDIYKLAESAKTKMTKLTF